MVISGDQNLQQHYILFYLNKNVIKSNSRANTNKHKHMLFSYEVHKIDKNM
jgi:hypothetical protein